MQHEAELAGLVDRRERGRSADVRLRRHWQVNKGFGRLSHHRPTAAARNEAAILVGTPQ
jgi:hypothetical protein